MAKDGWNCFEKGGLCEYANSFGQCTLTVCIRPAESEEYMDITYCGKTFCKHTECERHIDNIPQELDDSFVPFAQFTECEYWDESEE